MVILMLFGVAVEGAVEGGDIGHCCSNDGDDDDHHRRHDPGGEL